MSKHKPLEYNALEHSITVNDSGTISGYVVAWDVEDNKGDIHRRGAYKKTIMEHNNVPFLPNHDQSNPIGRAFNFIEDDYGLKFEANFASTDRAQEYRTLVKEGVIRKFSMGWNPLRFRRLPSGGREILEVRLREVSPVAIPVGDDTMVLEVNSLAIEEMQEKPDTLDRFYNLIKNVGDKNKKSEVQTELIKLAEEYRKATQPSEDTAPEVDAEAAKKQVEQEELAKLNEALDNYLKD